MTFLEDPVAPPSNSAISDYCQRYRDVLLQPSQL